MADRTFWRDVALITAAALMLRGFAAILVPWSPYLDASYYTVVAERLATGEGFTVPVIWSFLDVGGRLPADPTLPIPSNRHWPPLGPMLSAAGMWVFGPTWQAGQVPQVLVSAVIPAFTYVVARDFIGGRGLAIGAALLAIFTGPLFILYPAIDNFALFGLFGTAVLWMSGRAVRSSRPGPWLIGAGAVVGLATLTRIDGILMALAVATAWLIGRGWTPWKRSGGRPTFLDGFASAGAFLLVIGPWLVRQALTFGTPMPASGGNMLWITNYNEQFSIGRELTLGTYLEFGWANIIGSKLSTLGVISGRTMVLMGGFLVLSFVGGLWTFRRRAELAPFYVYFLTLFFLMAALFTFHAPQSAWYHSAPAWLGVALPLALAGIPPSANAAGRFWPFLRRSRTHAFLGGVGVLGAIVLSVLGSWSLHNSWVSSRERDLAAARFFIDNGLTEDVVMYREASTLHLLTGNPAVAFPVDPYPVIEEVIRAYGVEWVVVSRLETELRAPLGLWDGGRAVDAQGNPADFLADDPVYEADDVRVYEVLP
jgi:4-amino-4-deoxy-L-arabinose transferase-like glycosyltransferase